MIHVNHDDVWKSNELGLMKKDFIHTEKKGEAALNRLKISNWLWDM